MESSSTIAPALGYACSLAAMTVVVRLVTPPFWLIGKKAVYKVRGAGADLSASLAAAG